MSYLQSNLIIKKMKLNNIILSYEFRKYEEIDLKSVTNFKVSLFSLG